MQCTEVGFTSFLSSGFSIATTVHCTVADNNCETFYLLVLKQPIDFMSYHIQLCTVSIIYLPWVGIGDIGEPREEIIFGIFLRKFPKQIFIIGFNNFILKENENMYVNVLIPIKSN